MPTDLDNVVSISAGRDHNLALKADGTVVAWGRNYSNSTDIPDDLTDVVDIDAGQWFSLALKSDGTVVGWGWDGYNILDIVGFDYDFILVQFYEIPPPSWCFRADINGDGVIELD